MPVWPRSFAGCSRYRHTPTSEHFSGTVNGGGTVNFDVKFKHGKARKAGAFAFKQVPEKCDEETIPVNTSTVSFVKVKHRRFHYSFRGFTAHLKGRITHHGRRHTGCSSTGRTTSGTTTTAARAVARRRAR